MAFIRRKSLSSKVDDEGGDDIGDHRKKKNNVIEIDGAMWAVDEHGNPIKRLRKKQRDSTNEDREMVTSSHHIKKKKKNIVEIDGQLWMLDDNGNPLKKVRKKTKDEDNNNSFDERDRRRGRSRSRKRNENSLRQSSRSKSKGENRNRERSKGRLSSIPKQISVSDEDESASSSLGESLGRRHRPKSEIHREYSFDKLVSQSQHGKKKKKNVVEIDGQLWACDESGNPVKKVRRKGGPDADKRGRSRSRAASKRSKSNSSKHQQQMKDGSFTDAKGRLHVFEKGVESVFDKNGKKLRRKADKQTKSIDNDFRNDGMIDEENQGAEEKREVEDLDVFNLLWDEDENTPLPSKDWGADSSPLSPTQPSRNTSNAEQPPTELSGLQISEIDKRNRELQIELQTAKEEMERLAEKHRKEKSKNVKQMTEMMQLKADYHDANSELMQLRNKVTDLTMSIEEKERELEKAKEEVPSGSSGEQITELEAEKDKMESKLELEKVYAQKEVKKKEEQLARLNRELGVLRNELEMLITGKKGNLEVDPIMSRLIREKKEFEEKYNQEKEVNTVKISNLQEMIDTLETMNTELNKEMLMRKAGNERKMMDGSMHSNSIHTRRARRQSDFERKPPEPSRSFDLSPGTLSKFFGGRQEGD